MSDTNPQIWEEKLPKQFLNTISAVATTDALPIFLRDVLTEKEITEISARLEAARLLRQSVPYGAIVTQTKLSTRTIARISQWLQNGTGGYDAAFAITSSQPHHSHTSPVRAE